MVIVGLFALIIKLTVILRLVYVLADKLLRLPREQNRSV